MGAGMAALIVVACAGCDVAEPDTLPAQAMHDTRAESDAGDDTSAPPSPSTPEDELVSTGGAVGEARDDLFPDLSGNDLVWLRIWLDEAAPGAAADTDCLVTPYMAGCRFDAMYRALPDGPAEVLYEGRSPRSAPRVGDGLAVWLEDGGGLIVRELATRSQRPVPVSSWVPTTPTPFDGELWWYGYDSWSGGYGLMAYDLASELTELRVSTYLQDPHWSPSSQLSQLSQRQPFSAGDERIVWVAWDGTQVVQEWPYGGKPDTIVSEPSRAAVRALLLDDDVLVTMSQTNVGCQPSACELDFTSYEGSDEHALAADAEPSRYVPPVADGGRIVWLDRRNGMYEVWGAAADGSAMPLSSVDAVIGAVSTLAASEGLVVWADRRSGRFRLMAAQW